MQQVCFCATATDISQHIIARWRDSINAATAGEALAVIGTARLTGIFSPARQANLLIRQAIEASEHTQIIVKTDIDCTYSPALTRELAAVRPGYALCPIIWFDTPEQIDGLRNSRPCGTLAMHRTDWLNLRGYDERMEGHGREDGEMIERAMAAGITIYRTDRPLVVHQWHAARTGGSYPLRAQENRRIEADNLPWHETPGSERWGKGETP